MKIITTTTNAGISISNVRFAAAGDDERRTGLVGYVSAVVNASLRLDGIAVRRAAADGHLFLSFPARRDAAGEQHPYVRPVNDRARREMETQVFAALCFDAPRS